jgi:heat shock protein HslJ
MVLAGALTFLAVGIAPIKARRRSAAFVRNQLFLFLALTIAVSIPLWFYSEEILFNAKYQAARSVPLQEWLQNNELELSAVDISKAERTLTLGLEGPNPPVNVDELHRALVGSQADDDGIPFLISYTWTQKVSGVWPQEASTIDDIAKRARASTDQMIGQNWEWEATQYDSKTAARPSGNESYTLFFNEKGKLQIFAPCGNLKGKYTFNGRSLIIEMNRNLLSRCRNNDTMLIFTDDLERGGATFIEKNRLQVTLKGSAGVMYFRKK